MHAKPYMVNPATFPNTVMNTCSGQIAIRHGLLGVNAAISGGALSWLLAVRYARTALTSGRADRLLVGAVEEVSARTAWAWHLTGLLTAEAPLGEGAAFFVVEPVAGPNDGAAPVAELLGCEVGYFGGAGPGLSGGLRRCIASRCSAAGRGGRRRRRGAGRRSGHTQLAPLERRALGAELGGLPESIDVVPTVGEAYSAGGALQLAALLATTGSRTAAGSACSPRWARTAVPAPWWCAADTAPNARKATSRVATALNVAFLANWAF